MKELPTDTLANGAEGIKDLIKNFDEAYVGRVTYITNVCLPYPTAASRISRTSACRQNCMTQILRKAEQ